MTWQVGDLAVCVDDAPCRCCGSNGGMVAKRIYRVSQVMCDGRGLNVSDIDPAPHVGIVSSRFRKVVQDKREACEDEFVTLLKRSKRKVGA